MRQLVRYGIVGLMLTAINYAVFTAGIVTGLHYLAAATISSAVIMLAGYFLNRTFTFSAPGAASMREFVSFLGVFAVQYVLAMVGYMLLIGYLRMNPSLAFILNNIVIASVAFSLLRYCIFHGAHRR